MVTVFSSSRVASSAGAGESFPVVEDWVCSRQWCFIDLRSFLSDVGSGRASMVWEAVHSVVYWLVSS